MKLYKEASLMMLPTSVKDGKLYSIFPQPKVIGEELVTNGTFDEDAWWNKGAGWTISDGKANATSAAFSRLETPSGVDAILTIGKIYKCTFTVVDANGGEIYVERNINDVVLTGVDSVGNYAVYFTATDDQLRFQSRNTSSISIDNISVVEVDQAPADFDFSRGSNLAATRINEQGLIEKGRENLLTHSNEFDNTSSWTIANASTPTGGQTGYDGSNDAWLFEATGVAARLVQNNSASGVQTFSCYAKAGTANYLAFYNIVSGSPARAWFNLSNGTVENANHYIDANIESVGSGWYRCSLTYNDTLSNARIYVADAAGDFATSLGDNIYIQDAQLEVGLVATDYIESGATTGKAGVLEDLPRLDWSGSCPSLLLEPQRTNLVTHSEVFEYPSYSSPDAQILNTTDITPEGSANARVLAYNGGTNQHYINYLPSVTNGQTYTFSVFLKKKELQYAALIFLNDFAGQYFDLENGIVLGAIGAGVIDSKIEDYGNGWYRCSITDVATASTKFSGVYLSENGTSIGPVTPTNTDGIYIYGFQVEQGSYATSYIPTHGTSVTRSGEIFSNTDLSDLGITDEFTLFIDTNGALVDGVSLNSSGDLRWYTQSTNFYRFYKTSDFLWITTQIDVSDRTKIALRVRGLECKAFVDGVLHSTTTLTTPFSSFNSLYRNTEAKLKDELNEITLFPTALSDNECINLTSI